jgi:hypothetical protein
MRKRPLLAAALALGILGAGCVGGRLKLAPSPSPSSSSGPVVHPTVPPSQQNPLCEPGPRTGQPGPTAGSLPPDVAEVASQVQSVRELRFKRPVVPEPLSQDQIQQQLRDSLMKQFSGDQVQREGQTDITIGALPQGTDLRQVLVDYGTSQIVGFYDTENQRLVFEGGAEPTPFERFTLAHELTHALQDQNFGLSLLDRLNDTCQDERAEAFLSLAEGDAVQTQVQWARTNLSAEELVQLQDEANSFPPPPPTPPFVEKLFQFPYPNGQAFVEALQNRGGEQAVDDAFRDPPVSTEQILHPNKYPDDVPQAVAVPDLSSKLGQGWSLLDQQEIGEGWLLTLLQLRLAAGRAKHAAAGWDGGLLRSWTDGSRTAVVIQTVWDSGRDAKAFAAAMKDWFDQQAAEVHRDGDRAQVLFASDAQTLATLATAAGR